MAHDYWSEKMRIEDERFSKMFGEILPRLRAAGFDKGPLFEIDSRGGLKLNVVVALEEGDGTDGYHLVPIVVRGVKELRLVASYPCSSHATYVCYSDGTNFYGGSDRMDFPFFDNDNYLEIFAAHMLGTDPGDLPGTREHPSGYIDEKLGGSGTFYRSHGVEPIERSGLQHGNARAEATRSRIQKAVDEAYVHVDGGIYTRCGEPHWRVSCSDTGTLTIECRTGTVVNDPRNEKPAGHSNGPASNPVSCCFRLDDVRSRDEYVELISRQVEIARTKRTEVKSSWTGTFRYDSRDGDTHEAIRIVLSAIEKLPSRKSAFRDHPDMLEDLLKSDPGNWRSAWEIVAAILGDTGPTSQASAPDKKSKLWEWRLAIARTMLDWASANPAPAAREPDVASSDDTAVPASRYARTASFRTDRFEIEIAVSLVRVGPFVKDWTVRTKVPAIAETFMRFAEGKIENCARIIVCTDANIPDPKAMRELAFDLADQIAAGTQTTRFLIESAGHKEIFYLRTDAVVDPGSAS